MVTRSDLARRLLRWAAATRPGVEPAVRLLIASPWLADPRFLHECVVVIDEDIAVIDWVAVADVLAGQLDDVDESEALATLWRACEHALAGC